jgi:hypothetical protein
VGLVSAFVASTGRDSTAAVGRAVLAAGGNAVDAALAAALAWPHSLAAAGVLVTSGPGYGQGACWFPSHVPGYSIARPRRLRLLDEQPPSALTAAPCVAKALQAILTRWGTSSLAELIATVKRTFGRDAPFHEAALALLAQEGLKGFTHGPFAVEAALRLGPRQGGLLTRRDLIEARPEVGQAVGPDQGYWLAGPEHQAPSQDQEETPKLADQAEPGRMLSIIAVDRRKGVTCLSLQAGGEPAKPLPDIMGVMANTLLAEGPTALLKRVGHPLPLGCAAAIHPGDELVAVAGFWPALRNALGQDLVEAEELPEANELLIVRRRATGHLALSGAAAVEHK